MTNSIDPQTQKELHKQTVELRQAFELVINMELGMRNQQQIQQHNKTLIPASVNSIQYPPSTRLSNWSFSKNFFKQSSRPPICCSISGGNCFPKHWENCIAKGKTCNNCGLVNNFAKVCRKQKNQKPQIPKKRSVNTVNGEPNDENPVKFLL